MNQCVCCGATDQLEIDHILPRAKGGDDTPNNRQLLCRRCNLSKGSGEACTITHALDVMMPNHQGNHRDAESGEVTHQGSKRSGSAAIKRSNPQVNWRVEEGLKRDIEETAKRRGLSAGEVIREVWESRDREALAAVAEILEQVGTVLRLEQEQSAQIRELLAIAAPPAPEPTTFPPEHWAYLHELPPLPVIPPHPSHVPWWRRLLFR